MKKGKKIGLIVLGVVGGLILLACLVFFKDYPRFVKNKHVMEMEQNREENVMRVMSYNIRCLTPLDLGEKNWFYRAHYVAQCIEEQAPDVIGFQEVTSPQYDYLCDVMEGYDSIIDYRDNAINSEGCPVFYNTAKFELVDKGSFWLSETPDVMSKDWGAACYRICSYTVLKDKVTGKEFAVFNAHLDHVSDEARINGIQVVLDKIQEFGSVPAILMGDLNAEEYTATYKSATEAFLDAKYQTEDTMTSCTFQSWGEELDNDCIDYIMISPGDFQVDTYRVVRDTYEGTYASYHFGLWADLRFAE
ncbi:MAG: endonuclease/exonuclease/phosphatase family protein [Agathobacter sp.]|nr:endonuclease/exonuclease/phosphatase family protein [Agathobacter sp.]